MRLKKGITLIVLILTIILALILVTATTLAIGNSVENARLAAFANDLKEVKDAVKVYYMENDFFPTDADNMEALSQKEIFTLIKNKVIFKQDLSVNNDYNENDDLGAFYKIDLKVLGIEQTIRGIKENGQEDDIYVVSYPSMQIYYIAGVKAKSNTYYSLSTRLTDVVKVVNAPTEYPDNDIQSAYGMTVKKLKKVWTNTLNISIEAQMAATEGLYLKVQGGTEKKITTTVGQNIFKLDSFDKIYSQNTNTILNTNIPATDINNFNNSIQDNKYIEIIKKDEEKASVVGTIKVSLSNYETNIPVKASDSILTPGEEYNTVTFKAFDATSGVREVRYEYLKKFDERSTLPSSYYDGVTEYDPSYIKARGKKAEIGEDGTVKIDIPKEIEGIEIRIFDRAGNVSDKILQSNKRNIWVGIERVIFSADMARFLFTFNSKTNITEASAQISGDGKTYSKSTLLSVPNVSNNIASIEATFTDINIQDTIYVKVSAKNASGDTETRVKKFNVTGEAVKDNIGKLMSYSQTIDGRAAGTYQNPIIPAGFAAVNTVDSKWDAKTGPEYNNGLVIEDAIGNQFVWVPVPNIANFKRMDWAKQNYTVAQTPEDETTAEYIAMKQSVTENKGFYIARYEAGIPGTTSSVTTNHNTPTDGSIKPVSKQGVGVWNFITWGVINNTVNPGNGAVTLARSMYPSNAENHSGVISTLCYDVQWDATLKFMQGKDSEYITNSTGKGNYKPNPMAVTGSKEEYKVCNISDMSGNFWEWTMASYGSTDRVLRGGDFTWFPTDRPVSYRGSLDFSGTGGQYYTMRPTLYIKGTGEGTKNPSDLIGLNQAEKSRKPYIPTQFEWVSGTTVDTGYVIRGSDGSEFVWVPVDGTKIKYEKWCTTGLSYTVVTNVPDKDYPTGITSANEKVIVDKAGGFYVGRYEAGVPEGQTKIDGASAATSNVYGKPVSKKGAISWTNIDYIRANGNAISYISNTEVTSGLVTGTSWDTVMKWIDSSGKNVMTNSASWGNYYNSTFIYTNSVGLNVTKPINSAAKIPTGSTEYTISNNIYDIAGNVNEWSLEKNNTNYIIRSGYYGDMTPAANRAAYIINTLTNENLGFRLMLYVKI
ncbi:MAG: hypothetical protein PHP54_02825 [Clostridia bacterium]|nr:hypothetical protein [Clostridia bacterium]